MLPDKQPAYTYRHTLRSRYGETDKMGYVYYGRYLEYFEEARTEMIRELGMPYSELEERGILLPVVHTSVDYKAPIYYDELIHVHVHLYELPSVKLQTWYRIFTDRMEKPHAVGNVTLCFMKASDRKPCRAPAEFLEGLERHMNGTG